MPVDQSSYLAVKNWWKFQHYKDRNPPWIKLHVSLLDDREFYPLQDEYKWYMVGIWVLAARTGNRIPNDARYVGRMIGARKRINLNVFLDAGFLVPWSEGVAAGKHEDWPTRYIPPELREAVLQRDSGQCVQCYSIVSLEIDHITPVSLGGKSELSNLQVLCRSCNRKKINRPDKPSATQGYAAAETCILDSSPETEIETETEVYPPTPQGVTPINPLEASKIGAGTEIEAGTSKSTQAINPPLGGAGRKRRPPFMPPTKIEAAAYHTEKKYIFDVGKWWDTYTDPAQGWYLSNGDPMRSWRMNMRTWNDNEIERRKRGGTGGRVAVDQRGWTQEQIDANWRQEMKDKQEKLRREKAEAEFELLPPPEEQE